jgi:hypothetical protein
VSLFWILKIGSWPEKIQQEEAPELSLAQINNFITLMPGLGGRVRKLSKSSEDILGKSEKLVGELKDGLSASLQKDLNMVSFVSTVSNTRKTWNETNQ